MLGNWIFRARSLRSVCPRRRKRHDPTPMDKRRQFFRPACEELEARRLLTGTSGATLDFQGFNLSFNAKPGFANSVTLSLSGDTYSFVTDSLNKITAVNNLPKGYTYQIAGLRTSTVTIKAIDAGISSITFNLNDGNDTLKVLSARDAIVVNGGTGTDTTRLSNKLNLVGGLTANSEQIYIDSSSVVGASIATTANQVYSGELVLLGDTILTSPQDVSITGSINGSRALTINSGGVTTLGGPVGNTTALTSLSTNAAGSTRLAGGSVTTSGNQNYQDAVTLVSNLVVSGANVTFGASVNGPFGLAINGGKAALNGAVGDVSPLSSLNVTSSQALQITRRFGPVATWHSPSTISRRTGRIS